MKERKDATAAPGACRKLSPLAICYALRVQAFYWICNVKFSFVHLTSTTPNPPVLSPACGDRLRWALGCVPGWRWPCRWHSAPVAASTGTRRPGTTPTCRCGSTSDKSGCLAVRYVAYQPSSSRVDGTLGRSGCAARPWFDFRTEQIFVLPTHSAGSDC